MTECLAELDAQQIIFVVFDYSPYWKIIPQEPSLFLTILIPSRSWLSQGVHYIFWAVGLGSMWRRQGSRGFHGSALLPSVRFPGMVWTQHVPLLFGFKFRLLVWFMLKSGLKKTYSRDSNMMVFFLRSSDNLLSFKFKVLKSLGSSPCVLTLQLGYPCPIPRLPTAPSPLLWHGLVWSLHETHVQWCCVVFIAPVNCCLI